MTQFYRALLVAAFICGPVARAALTIEIQNVTGIHLEASGKIEGEPWRVTFDSTGAGQFSGFVCKLKDMGQKQEDIVADLEMAEKENLRLDIVIYTDFRTMCILGARTTPKPTQSIEGIRTESDSIDKE